MPETQITIRMAGSDILLQALAAHEESLRLTAELIKERDALQVQVDTLRERLKQCRAPKPR